MFLSGKSFWALFSIFMLLHLTGWALPAGNEEAQMDLKTVPRVDLDKYMGLWYEFARIPNSFQDDCFRNTTATYALREDGRVTVVNRCIDAEGDTIEARGIAQVVDSESRSKLEVSFVRILGINLFWGDYWIIGLADDYRYAVVGNPSRKYGWILTREPHLSDEDYESVRKLLQSQGYNPEAFKQSRNEYDALPDE